ncbi:FAD-dependent monooxygenase [Nocardia pseudovaccinii]|uniref:FAD-dependent monooxygenase n=1 Tax=Nocardia pseudovaccinii TaxID=189540 RepID=UPI003D8C55C9
MSAADVEVEVLIVGGGPVGLTARALLDRWGVRVMVVEKYGELSPFPRSRLVNVRSMEIFRQLGLADTITARAFAADYGRIRFRDTLQDRDFATAAMIGINAPIPESPAIGAITSQDRLEPTLLAASDAPVRFGVELIDLVEEPESVVAVLVDHGVETRVRARYVLAADGANSTVRRRLGIDTAGPGALGAVTTVVFDADLDRWCADQPAGVYFTAHGSFVPLYPEGGWAWFGPTPEDPERTDWSDLVSRTIGSDRAVPTEVLRVQHWVMNAFVAERFGRGRILLAGDAVHAIPILGGLGMNTGIADVHNLCWKLAGVLRGWAAANLLETYEAERLPVAQLTLQQAVTNARIAGQAQNRRRSQRRNGAPESDVDLPWSDQFFAQLGLVLGVAYRSAAVITDGSTPPNTGTDYVPVPKAGHRLPHLWLTPTRSTLDTLGEWFTLLTPDPASWAQPVPWPVHVEPLPGDQLYDLGPNGALLVRPDGYIAAHWSDRPRNAALQEALTTITRATFPE